MPFQPVFVGGAATSPMRLASAARRLSRHVCRSILAVVFERDRAALGDRKRRDFVEPHVPAGAPLGVPARPSRWCCSFGRLRASLRTARQRARAAPPPPPCQPSEDEKHKHAWSGKRARSHRRTRLRVRVIAVPCFGVSTIFTVSASRWWAFSVCFAFALSVSEDVSLPACSEGRANELPTGAAGALGEQLDLEAGLQNRPRTRPEIHAPLRRAEWMPA